MLSRIFWFGVAGIALIGGIALQDGGWLFSWGDQRSEVSASTERAIEAGVDQAVNRSVGSMQVTGPDGKEIDVPPEAKRALADAIGRMVEAQADLVVLKVSDADSPEINAATARRDEARAELDRLKEVIRKQQEASAVQSGELREQVQREIREDLRAEIRQAVRN